LLSNFKEKRSMKVFKKISIFYACLYPGITCITNYFTTKKTLNEFTLKSHIQEHWPFFSKSGFRDSAAADRVNLFLHATIRENFFLACRYKRKKLILMACQKKVFAYSGMSKKIELRHIY
jgi:hypothetical protein